MANDRSVPEEYNGKNIWSYSKLGSYVNCPYGYYLNYLATPKPKSIQNVYSYMGTICHDIAEELQLGNITIEQGLKEFDKRVKEMEMDGFYFGRKVEKDNYFYSVLDYIKNFKAEVGNVKVEQKEFLEIDENNVLMMFIDLIVKLDENTLGVYDYKTSSEFKKDDMQKHGRQLIIYALTLSRKYKKYKNFKLAWLMIKYYHVTYNKRKKQVYRAKLVSTYQKQIIKELMKLGMSELEANNIYVEALSTNTLPSEIAHLFSIEPCVVEWEFSQENIDETLEYLNTTIESALTDTEFKPRDLDPEDSNHFCRALCGQRENCKYLKELDNNKFNMLDLDDEDLF